MPMMAISAVGNLRELGQRVLAIARGSGEAAAPSALSDAESALIAIHGGGQITQESLKAEPVVQAGAAPHGR